MLGSFWVRYATLALLPLASCSCEEDRGLVDVSAELEIAPLEVDFGRVAVGGSRVRSVTLTNKGGLALPLASVRIEGSGEIFLAAQIPEVLTARQSLVVNLAFEPTDVGFASGELVVALDEGTQRIPLRAEGVASGAELAGLESCGYGLGVAFGQVAPGATATRSFRIVAEGTSPLSVLSAVRRRGSDEAFTIDGSALPVTLDPGQSLELQASFTPVRGGPADGAFVITTDSAATPSLGITACGDGVAPGLCARPIPLDLGAAVPGTPVQADLTLESCGREPVEVQSIAFASGIVPGFSVTPPSLPRSLAPSETMVVTVAFTPSTFGGAQADLEIGSTAFGQATLTVPVIARGAMPCGLEVVPARLLFTSAGPERAAVLVNSGAQTCTLDRIEITSGQAQFTLPSPPPSPATLAPGGTLDLLVRHTPGASGPDMGQLEVEEGGAIQRVELVGNPDLSDGCHLEVVPAVLAFGAVPPGEVRSLTTKLRNLGQAPCFLRGVRLGTGTHPDFVENAPSLGLILPGRDKDLAVTYTPSAPGVATGTLEIDTNDVSTGRFSVPLVAASAAAGLCVHPTALDFGDVSTVRDRTFELSACGGRAVTVTALDFSTADPEFSLLMAPSLPLALAAGASETITVRYAPADMTGDTAIVTVRSDDPARAAVPVRVTGGPEIVPATAGRYLYYWQIPSPLGGDIMQLPLQGNTTAAPWWGPRTGKACAGCHNVSPDGRYVAIIEAASFRIVDTTSNVALAIPNGLVSPSYLSWNPDVNTTPPYQYAYDAGGDIAIAALFDGELRKLQGADDANWTELMPTWGSDGNIAFARGMSPTQNQNGGNSFGFQGPVDILTVPATGGTPRLLRGAGGDGAAHYYPQYSPNGRFIALTYSRGAQSTIAATDARVRLVAANGSGQVLNLPNLNGNNGASSYPTWSVDGRFLSFSSNRTGGLGDWDIYLAPIDPITGADRAAINVRDANSRSFEHAAQWSP